MTRAVVLGGSFAGLLAALAIRGHVEEVVVIERDKYPYKPGIRKGLPQSSSCHLIVEGCALAIEELLPGFIDALLSRGAKRIALTEQTLIQSPMGWFGKFHIGSSIISCSRGLLDHVLRDQIGIPVWQGVSAQGLIGNNLHVKGVKVVHADGRHDSIYADLVIDAMGRQSKAARWLASLGLKHIENETVESGLASSSRRFEIPLTLLGKLPAIILQPQIVQKNSGCGATLYPIENGQFIVTLTGPKEHPPPIKEGEFIKFSESLGHGIIADLLNASVPVDRVRAYRNLCSTRRYLEKANPPTGFLAIGDSLIAVEPGNSHGMANAAFAACQLKKSVARFGFRTSLQSIVADAAEAGWRMILDPYLRRGLISEISAERTPNSLDKRIMAATPRNLNLARDFFEAHMLIPNRATRNLRDRFCDAVETNDMPLSASDAIAQYSELDAWWCQISPQSESITSKNVDIGINPRLHPN